MNKHVKRTLIFTSGVFSGLIIGGIGFTYKLINDDYMRKALVTKISDSILDNIPKKVSYREYYDRSIKKPYRFDNPVFSTKVEAMKTLECLTELLSRYSYFSVGDLYDLSSIPTNHRDNSFGWTTLTNVTVKEMTDGWIITLSKPRELFPSPR